MGLDAHLASASFALFGYIRGLSLEVEVAHIGIVHASPMAVVVVIEIHNNIGVTYGSATPTPFLIVAEVFTGSLDHT